jgi:Mrp family chromosome partitioning ATPase
MNETTDATAIFAPIWRRKWLIIAVAIIVGAASYVYYKHERPTYQASTQIFAGAGAEEQASSEKTGGKHSSSLADQAAVINTIIVEEVRHRLKSEHKGALARKAKVKAKAPEKSEFITITTEAHSARNAALLANLTAQTYVARLERKHQRAIEKELAISRRQLRRIEASALAKASEATSKKKNKSTASSGSEASTSPSASDVIQEANLSSKINQLEASLGTVSAQQVKPAKAESAQLLSPKPRKDAIYGFVIGLVLAAIASYAFSRFDRRLRSLAAIEAVSGLPLLSAMPKVRRPIVRGEHLLRPSVNLLEPLRRLQTALALGDGAPTDSAQSARPRVILFVSPDPGDGKSTIVADLALVQRDAGERVVVVEANFRRPVQSRLLGLDSDQQGGLAPALTGRLDIDDAMQRVVPATPGATQGVDGTQGVATAVQTEVGSLFLLAGDRSVNNPPALLAHEIAPELIRSLAQRFDYVLIDAPSPLEVSDVIPLLGVVDRIVVVARIGHAREVSAQRLRQLLDSPSCARVAGVVANFVSAGELKRYGFSVRNAGIWPGGRSLGR